MRCSYMTCVVVALGEEVNIFGIMRDVNDILPRPVVTPAEVVCPVERVQILIGARNVTGLLT